jgi:outer membrane immunogenic protein
MKRLVVGVAAAFIATAGPAAAEGLPPTSRIKAPGVVVGPSWNGFYVGAGIGAGALSQNLDGDKDKCIFQHFWWWSWKCDKPKERYPYAWTSKPFEDSDTGDIGVFGTITLGYDRVLRPGWVGGVFADYDFGSNLSADVKIPYHSGSLDHNYSWAIGGRLGYLVTPSTLLYGTGGYTQADFDVSDLGSKTFAGFFVGGGVETFLRQSWTLKLEYRYSQFESETFADGPVTFDIDPSMHTARLVLSYKFGQRD